MLLLGSRLIGMKIMSLQTGSSLATIKSPVIDPGNLKIMAYEVEGPLLSERPSLIRIADVRELSDIGMIVDSNDEFIGIHDVISIEKIYNLNFKLLGLTVIDELKHRLGKVVDYSLDTNGFVIQQLKVNRGPLKSLSETELLIHRSQIIEINDENIIVRSASKKLEPISDTDKFSYFNPFRSPPQVENNNQSRSG